MSLLNSATSAAAAAAADADIDVMATAGGARAWGGARRRTAAYLFHLPADLRALAYQFATGRRSYGGPVPASVPGAALGTVQLWCARPGEVSELLELIGGFLPRVPYGLAIIAPARCSLLVRRWSGSMAWLLGRSQGDIYDEDDAAWVCNVAYRRRGDSTWATQWVPRVPGWWELNN